jgi:hypothetical protein
MHIASALTLVRRDSVQSDVAVARGGRVRAAVPFQTPETTSLPRAQMRKLLPGAILVTVLVVIGGLFPILF